MLFHQLKRKIADLIMTSLRLSYSKKQSLKDLGLKENSRKRNLKIIWESTKRKEKFLQQAITQDEKRTLREFKSKIVSDN